MQTDPNQPFAYEKWELQLPRLAGLYQRAQPFPHLHLENLLDEQVALQMAREFPGPRDISWIHYKHYNENKLGKNRRDEFPPAIGRAIDEFNRPRFVAFLSKLTGIEGLMADPGLEGGGMHQTERGGFLNVHADFTMHPRQKHWRRRVNFILYLNATWERDWGGELELWDRQMRKCIVKIPPLLNHAAVFSTDDTSFHGYPDPIESPPEMTRKSLALYYYTVDTNPACVARSTNYQPRPGESRKTALFIWADRMLVHYYSILKRRLGVSDEFAGKLLGCFSRNKKKS